MDTSSPTPAPAVRVRMYRQGLGDCFLLTFPRAARPFHLLIDCGVLLGTEEAQQKMQAVVNDIKTETDGRLDVVAATHEHWDHLSGFVQAQDLFDQIKIDRVWLAWTEDPTNALAQQLRASREERLNALYAAVARMAAAEIKPPSLDATREVLGLYGELPDAGGSSNTKTAMDYISKRRDARIYYCYPGQPPLSLDGVEGVRIFVFGPPQDEALIRRGDPTKKGKEVYTEFPQFAYRDAFLGADQPASGAGGVNEAQTTDFPFERQYRVPRAEALSDEFFLEHYGFEHAGEQSEDWRRIDDDWLAVAGELALALDSDTNNTSLVLAIELLDTGKVLLFPGDAQVGNWLSWEPLEWKLADVSGQARIVTSKDLLGRTVLYKVGHHGSHNATLREKGLELMQSQELAAMIPINQDMAQRQRWNMPFPPLLQRLEVKTRGRIIRADSGLPPSPAEAKDFTALTEAEWEQFASAAKVTDLYIELAVG